MTQLISKNMNANKVLQTAECQHFCYWNPSNNFQYWFAPFRLQAFKK